MSMTQNTVCFDRNRNSGFDWSKTFDFTTSAGSYAPFVRLYYDQVRKSKRPLVLF